MLDGNRRGYMIGFETEGQVCMLPGSSVDQLAAQQFDSLTKLGYAHLEPWAGFLRSFLEGFGFARDSHITKEVSYGTTQLS